MDESEFVARSQFYNQVVLIPVKETYFEDLVGIRKGIVRHHFIRP